MPALLSLPRAARLFARECWQRLGRALQRPARPATDLALLRSAAPDTRLAREINKRLAQDVTLARHYLVEHFRQRTAPRFFLDAGEIRAGIAQIQQRYPEWRTRLAQSVEAYRPTADQTDAQDQILRDREHLLHFVLDLSRALLHGDADPDWLKAKLDAWLAAIATSREPDAYASPLLAVFRSISITWSLAFLGARGKPDTLDIEFDLLRILLGDANFIAGQLGESFANNHLLADGFALWYIGALYPEFAQAEDWRRAGEKVWLRELTRQIYTDGTSFEHALHYHNFACEMTSVYMLLSRRNNREPKPEIVQLLSQMLCFQSALCRFGANPPQPGDSGDASLLALDTAHTGLCLAYGALDRALFQSTTPLMPPDHPALERAFWMLGGQLGDSVGTSTPILTQFTQGGFAFFNDAVRDSQLLFRTGPAPDVSLNPGHMHADLLSMYLNVAGEPAIVEAGTYTYRSTPNASGPHWREYFLSAYAHNGLCLDGHDPLARGPGSFPGGQIQSRVISAVPLLSQSLAYLSACTEGTTPYSGHCRSVLQVTGEYWLVHDLLPAGRGAASIGWQFSAQARVTPHGTNALHIKLPHADLSLAMCGGEGRFSLLTGSLDPLGGWVSPRYGERLPATMARWQVSLGAPLALGTLITSSASDPIIDMLGLTQHGVAYQINLGIHTDYVFLARDAACPMSYAGIQFTGRVLWLRVCEGRPIEIRWLDARSLDWPDQGLLLRAENSIASLQMVGPNDNATHPDLNECRWR